MGPAASCARSRPAGRLLPPARGRFQLRQEREARPGPRRRATDAARSQDRLYRTCHPSRQRGSPRQGKRSAERAGQIARAVAAVGRLARIERTTQPRGDGCRRRADTAGGDADGDHRAHSPDHRAIDSDRRAPRQPARHRRAADPAAGRRPHFGAGPRSAGPEPFEGTAGQDRKNGIPDGRFDRAAGPGAAGQGAPRLRSADEFDVAEDSLRHQKAGSRFRRRLDRRATGLRSAFGRTDRQLPFQHLGLAQIRPSHFGECRPALCDRARQRGHFRARDS